MTSSTSTKKDHLFILAITSIFFSSSMFSFFNDPEGTNLLVTTVMAAFVYVVTLAIYSLKSLPVPPVSKKRLILVIILQLLFVTGLYFSLK